MLLIAHILIALSSLVLTGYVYFFPTPARLKASYALVGLTIATGTYLIITSHTHILQTCVTGLVYLGVVFAGIIAAKHKMAKFEN